MSTRSNPYRGFRFPAEIINQAVLMYHCFSLSLQASEAARDVYNRGEHYVRQAREQSPEAERYIRAGQRAVTQRVTENPLLALLVAGIAGYALAWLIHSEK